MTLTELLIVVAVMVVLLGLALPTLKTGLEGRRIREATRQLNTYVELAKAQAAETGRLAGLILKVETLPDEGLPEDGLPYVSEVFLAQTPQPYVGDMVTARATITGTGNTATLVRVDNASLPFLVRLGDQIRFDYRGVLHTITRIDDTSYPLLYEIEFTGSPLPPVGARLPYQIYRRPEKSSSTPMEMAAGTVIDLSMSGFGLSEVNSDPFDTVKIGTDTIKVESVVIIFNPAGEMIRVLVNKVRYDASGNGTPLTPVTITPTDTLHLMVGKLDGVLLDDAANVITGDDLETNLENPESMWASIGHQTGRVTTTENGWTVDDQFSMATAREFAQSGKAMGGR